MSLESRIEARGRRVLRSPLWVGLAITAFLVDVLDILPLRMVVENHGDRRGRRLDIVHHRSAESASCQQSPAIQPEPSKSVASTVDVVALEPGLSGVFEISYPIVDPVFVNRSVSWIPSVLVDRYETVRTGTPMEEDGCTLRAISRYEREPARERYCPVSSTFTASERAISVPVGRTTALDTRSSRFLYS